MIHNIIKSIPYVIKFSLRFFRFQSANAALIANKNVPQRIEFLLVVNTVAAQIKDAITINGAPWRLVAAR